MEMMPGLLDRPVKPGDDAAKILAKDSIEL